MSATAPWSRPTRRRSSRVSSTRPACRSSAARAFGSTASTAARSSTPAAAARWSPRSATADGTSSRPPRARPRCSPYMYYHHFTNELQERLRATACSRSPRPSMARARFVTGGSEANEMALRLARQYHEERGDDAVAGASISPAQAYHGATVRRARPHRPARASSRRTSPTWPATCTSRRRRARFDETGEKALDALDRVLEEVGDSIAAFVCEP